MSTNTNILAIRFFFLQQGYKEWKRFTWAENVKSKTKDKEMKGGVTLLIYINLCKDADLFTTVALVSLKSRAERLVSTRHHLPLPAWVMSERPGGDRGAFVALSVHTSEKLVSSGQKYFSLHLSRYSFNQIVHLNNKYWPYKHKWWMVLC